MLEIVKVALPELTNVAVRDEPVEPTGWLPKEMVAGVREKPAVDTGTGVLPPPPPQAANHRVHTMHAAARMPTLRRLR